MWYISVQIVPYRGEPGVFLTGGADRSSKLEDGRPVVIQTTAPFSRPARRIFSPCATSAETVSAVNPGPAIAYGRSILRAGPLGS